ncbi:MAG: hypothetical protein ACFFAN_02570 [Promethearchaeota archaeon]
MSLQDSLNLLNQKVKEFQSIVKKRVFNLGKFKIIVIKPNNKEELMTLSMGLYFLRNTIKEMLKSNIKLKDFDKLQKTIIRFFQKFIDTKKLINFDKKEDLFKELNENDSISPLKLLFCDVFHEKINKDVFKVKCNELKKSVSNFDSFKEKFIEIYSKIQYLKTLREKFEEYQKIINSGNLKKMNEENLEDFRLFRSFFPLNVNSKYLIDIKNRNIIKI